MSRINTVARKIALAVVALVVAGTLGMGVGEAKIPLKIGWNSSDGATDPLAIMAHEFAKNIELLAPGEFEPKLFPNAQLGQEKEMIEGLSFGTIDVSVINNSPVANVVPAFQLNDLPFLYGSPAQAAEVLDGPVGQILLSKLTEKNIIGLGFAENGFRNMVNNVRPVAKPEDVVGVKYRVMENPLYIEMFRALGGNAVPMAWGEVFTAMQQGTIDGLEIPVAIVANNKFYEVAKYLSLDNHTYSALVVMMAKKTWDKLNPDQRLAALRATEAAKTVQRAQNAKNLDALIAEIEQKGMKVNTIANPAEFRAKVGKVYDMFRDKIGADLLERALAAVK
jgi:tripartite ATP-independent transporter DctP family solute receptor